ncbi:MAG: Restriction endonuclease [Candidatus Methanofastidiosum methylothiophilum]|uniref:Restriction endonuclease n=1 Tax=Candidatus Methanofastidiosum methylothiophilum TaxID=1705564 RepID=A0A150IZU6_9EURY|nr:MAG: Restriction endonuclease [Candidatus Methanofastidiosum methylthiophilus]
MIEDKKYGFEEVDKLSRAERKFKVGHILYIIFFTLSYFYLMTLMFDSMNGSIFYLLINLYFALLLLILWGFSKSIESKAKERVYAKLMNEKYELEQKYINILNQNPNTLEDYIRAFFLTYGSEEPEYSKHSYNFKRLLYLNKKISSKQLYDVSEPDKIVAQVKEKIALEHKFWAILNENPVTLEDYVKLFSSTYGESYRDNIADFKRLVYLHGITIKSENEIELLLTSIEEKKQLNLLENKFKAILNENPVTLEDYVKLFSSTYEESYSDNLADFKRLLHLRGITIPSGDEIEFLLEAIKLNLLENKFKPLLNDESVTLKDYVGLFLSTYKNEYPVNLLLFKKMLLIQKDISWIRVEEEIKSYFFSTISNKSSFKSIYGVEPIYDFKLIHEFCKKYGFSYSEDDLENLSKLLITKGIKIHDKSILKELVSKANMERHYSLFTECMKTEIPLDETGYIQKAIGLFGNNFNKRFDLPYLHRFFIERNLTSLDYKNFEEYVMTRIFELSLLSDENKLSVHEVDAMDGYEFEVFVGQLYQKMGYSVEQTPLSNDQGADLIISKYGEKTAVQVKNYTSNVGNGAIQEVVAAKNYYGCSSCIVVANSYFTKSAIELADANGVKLVDRDELNYLINNKGIEINPKSDSALCVKGIELSSPGRYEEATILHGNEFILKGCELTNLGRYEEAIQAFDKAIEIDSKSEIPWSSKGWALSSLGRYEEAIQAYDKAIEIDSKYGSAWGGKSLALSSLGREEEANEAFDRAKELGYTES